MKLNQLDSEGFFVVDHVEGELPDNWTADLVNNGFYKAQYQNATINKNTGEWLGGTWVETGGPPVEDIENAKQAQIAIVSVKKMTLMSYASDMIGALSDEIEGLEDNNDNVPEKLRTDLKAWKQYRIAVKNIDVSLAPNIEWPVSPEAALTEA
ncbi:tail fiber assembly protein [Yersinia alsatica]|uniref:tail fiber assembly protein n=1 Tax=Yersinia alsatica TaxID=2890317 RepID=UPI00119ED764|nr:tail fiber assembly protein [Yersinia alsatica]